jgi:hypothetical protein
VFTCVLIQLDAWYHAALHRFTVLGGMFTVAYVHDTIPFPSFTEAFVPLILVVKVINLRHEQRIDN